MLSKPKKSKKPVKGKDEDNIQHHSTEMAHENNDQEGEQVHMSLLNSEEPDSEDVF